MGCAQSKVDNEESVSRCKSRKILMKQAVAARNAYAAGHSGYANGIKNTGAALSDYAMVPVDAPPPPPPPPPHRHENLPPPPPPPPNFSPSPIKRAVSMPGIVLKKQQDKGTDSVQIVGEEVEEEDGIKLNFGSRGPGNVVGSRGDSSDDVAPERSGSSGGVVPPMPEAKSVAWDYFFTVSIEADRDGDVASNVGGGGGGGGGGVEVEVEPRTPEREVETFGGAKEQGRIEHSQTAPPEFGVVGGGVSVSSVNLMRVLSQIDDHFLKASESAKVVSNMLEATRMHYHNNFAENRGHIDHSARVMRVITWNRSFRGIPNGEGGKDEVDSDDHETHATVLDKLLAWEKKLFEEVKQGELMKLEYKRKVALLNKQKKRGADFENLEKTKVAVSHLHTRYIVDMQSMDSTVLEVNQIRDEQLYPKLVAVVDGMAKMWASMCIHHDSQLKIVTDLKSLDVTHSVQETTKQQHERTVQLYKVVQNWHSQFENLVTHQKQYVQALNSWLKLNLIPIESNLKEKISSPPRVQNPPIQALLHSWHDSLEKLPDELAKSAISSFAAVIKTIMENQLEEMKLKKRCGETWKDYMNKNQAFEDWYHKHMQRRTTSDETDTERAENIDPKDPVTERRFVVESLKKRWEEEVEVHQRHCHQVRDKSIGSLKIRLPELFRALSNYSHACSDAYEKLRSITLAQNSKHAHR